MAGWSQSSTTDCTASNKQSTLITERGSLICDSSSLSRCRRFSSGKHSDIFLLQKISLHNWLLNCKIYLIYCYDVFFVRLTSFWYDIYFPDVCYKMLYCSTFILRYRGLHFPVSPADYSIGRGPKNTLVVNYLLA